LAGGVVNNNIDGWLIVRDSDGWLASDPNGQSWVRLEDDAINVRSWDGGCTISNKVIGTLELLRGCNCDPFEQTGGVHRHDCPCAEAECTCYEVTGGHQPGCAFNRRPSPVRSEG
jgi:hypothetical protein